MDMQERAIKAAIEHLKGKGYEELAEFEGHVVGYDDGTLAIVTVGVVDNFMDCSDHEPRDAREQVALRFLEECDYVGDVRFDDMQLIVRWDDRAFARFEKNCMSEW